MPSLDSHGRLRLACRFDRLQKKISTRGEDAPLADVSGSLVNFALSLSLPPLRRDAAETIKKSTRKKALARGSSTSRLTLRASINAKGRGKRKGRGKGGGEDEDDHDKTPAAPHGQRAKPMSLANQQRIKSAPPSVSSGSFFSRPSITGCSPIPSYLEAFLPLSSQSLSSQPPRRSSPRRTIESFYLPLRLS